MKPGIVLMLLLGMLLAYVGWHLAMSIAWFLFRDWIVLPVLLLGIALWLYSKLRRD